MSWNRKPFSIYTSEEKTVLGIIKELNDINQEVAEKTSENIEQIKILNNKKLSIDEYEKDITNNRKLSKDGNFTGTWFGLKKPTLSQEGAFAQVEKNMEDIDALKNIFNVFGGITLVDPNGQKWLLCVDNFGNLGTIKEEEI